MNKRPLALIAALGLVALALAVRLAPSLTQEHEHATTSVEPPVIPPVPTALVRAMPDAHLRAFPGKVRANRRVELAFSLPGLLQELNAREGRHVIKGELLAKLDQRDAQHALDAARARSADARRELSRLSHLRKERAIAEMEYDKAETAYHVALAELHIREKALEDTVLLAPFDGVVVKRYVENRANVQAKQRILSLQDISVVEVIFQAPEAMMARGGTDHLATLRVHFDADPQPDRWVDAEVREYSAESDNVIRTYDVVVLLDPPEGLDVFPGMTATVEAQMPSEFRANGANEPHALVPVEALSRDADGASYVWIIDPIGGHPKRATVQAVAIRGDSVEIGPGLAVGQHVAVAGLHAIREDLLLRPMASGKEGLDG